MVDRTAALATALEHARAFLDGLDRRPVRATTDGTTVRTALGKALPERGEDPVAVIDAVVAGMEPGLLASAGPRFFGFVVGGALPAALAADWLASTWDQNAFVHTLSPAAAAIEQITATWILDLLSLPDTATVGFVTGGQAASTTCLAAARHAVLARAGWDVETDGLTGAPSLRVLCSQQSHATIYSALRLLGIGTATATRIGVDDQGRMNPAEVRRALAHAGAGTPMIVCAQAGDVCTGAFDDFTAIADACAEHDAWLHIDGAFGLWAAAAPTTRHLTAGIERADSWAVDAHKWLNVPYDAGIAIVAHPDAHVAAMRLSGPYLTFDPDQRDNTDYVPECSRRARGIPIYAALRSLGRAGVAELIERNCAQARRIAARLREAIPGLQILNDVVLNQVLVRLPGDDGANRAAVAAIQDDGTCWLGGTTWNGNYVLRISLCNWATTDDDIDRAATAIAQAAQSSATATTR